MTVNLRERKALLAERLRQAYDTDRTSMLETFLSAGSFTDVLSEVSYSIDVGEQDKALAEQIVARPGGPRRDPPVGRRHARRHRRAADRRPPPRRSSSTRPSRSSRRPRPS